MQPNTTKVRALWSAILAGVAGFVSWLATVPPEQQSGWLAQLVEILPVSWRANVGLFTRFITFAVGIYAVYNASHSGPQTPPKNPPTE